MASRLKANVSALLEAGDLEALKALALGGQGIVRTLVSLLYSTDEELRWQAINALGEVSAALVEDGQRERVIDLVRRLFWALNDESGGIGWNVPEAVGEILARVPFLIATFGPPLVTHLDVSPYGPGVLWAIGRLAAIEPRAVEFALPRVRELLGDPEAMVRGRAAWALGRLGDRDAAAALSALAGTDAGPCSVFEDGRLRRVSVGELAAEALARLGLG